MADEGKVSEMFDMLNKHTDMMNTMMGQFKVITTEMAELRGQLEMMNGKLEQISKETDGKINNLTNKVNKENDEIKTQIKSITQNKVLEEASKALYVHNVDELTGVSRPNKGHLLRWAEETGLDKHLADIITLKSEGKTNAILKAPSTFATSKLRDGLAKLRNQHIANNKRESGRAAAAAEAIPAKGKPTWIGIEAYIPPEFGEEKKKLLTHGKKLKENKNCERYNVGIKATGPLSNKTYEVVLNYKTSEEGSKWNSIATKDINNEKKRKTTPPLGPGSKEQQLDHASEQTTTWSMVAGGKGGSAPAATPPPPVPLANRFVKLTTEVIRD